jgi:hydroxymethylbilane synthase
LDLIAPLNDPATQICVAAERAMNARLEGGCQVPIAGFATLSEGQLNMSGLVGRPDGSEIVSGRISGLATDAESLGLQLADDLLSRGAGDILRDVYANA